MHDISNNLMNLNRLDRRRIARRLKMYFETKLINKLTHGEMQTATN